MRNLKMESQHIFKAGKSQELCYNTYYILVPWLQKFRQVASTGIMYNLEKSYEK